MEGAEAFATSIVWMFVDMVLDAMNERRRHLHEELEKACFGDL